MITRVQPYSFKTNYSRPAQVTRPNQVNFTSTLPKISDENIILFKKLTDLFNDISTKNKNLPSNINLSKGMISVDSSNDRGTILSFVDENASKIVKAWEDHDKDSVFIRVVDEDNNIPNNYSKNHYFDGIDETLRIYDGESNFGDIHTYMNNQKWKSGLSLYDIDMLGRSMKPEFVEQFNKRIATYLPEITNRIDEFKKLVGI